MIDKYEDGKPSKYDVMEEILKKLPEDKQYIKHIVMPYYYDDYVKVYPIVVYYQDVIIANRNGLFALPDWRGVDWTPTC